MNLTFNTYPASSNGIGFIHAKCEEDNFHDCILYFDYKPNYKIGDKKFNSFQEMERFAKDKLASMHNPFNAAVLRVNQAISANVKKAAHQMDLRIANFRGNLFTQIIDLKHGPTYRSDLYDKIIEELNSDKIVGVEE